MIDLYKIEAFWDKEAKVWVAESTDILGLATEADTLEQLTEKLREIIPELLIANHIIPTNEKKAINFELITHRKELIQVA
jgi:predicted RNase H-like HicB family nuclease